MLIPSFLQSTQRGDNIKELKAQCTDAFKMMPVSVSLYCGREISGYVCDFFLLAEELCYLL
jgi:hypothetical protein